MNKKILLSSMLLLLTNSVFGDMDIREERTSFYERNKLEPIGFNYTYLETFYSYTQQDNSDISSQSIGAKVSFKTTQHISASIMILGDTDSQNNKSTDLHLGVNYHQDLTKNTDAYIELNFISLSANEGTGSASGSSLGLGIRQRINTDMEWGISFSRKKIEDFDAIVKTRVDFSYGSDSDDEIQYIVAYETTDADTDALFLGIRFNY